MPTIIATPSHVVSRKALLPARFNVSRILISPRENAEFVFFGTFRSLRRSQKLSADLPGTPAETRASPESSPRRNPSFSLRKTTPFRSKMDTWGTPTKPQPPAPVKLLSLLHPIPSPVQDPTRRRPRVGGFERPAATSADPEKQIIAKRICAAAQSKRTLY